MSEVAEIISADLEADRYRVILNKDRGVLDYFKLSKLLNLNYERYNHNGMTQEKLGELFGFSQSAIAHILPIYPRLEKYSHGNTLDCFSNHDLRELARVESDLLREWLAEVARSQDSKWIEKKATLCNELYCYVTNKISADKVRLVLEKTKPRGLSHIKNVCTCTYIPRLRSRLTTRPLAAIFLHVETSSS